jgi:hypothetical protein
MKTERKQIAGVLNLDDPNESIPSQHHKDARNILFRGNPGNFSIQSALGNRLVSNTLPAGTNTCIGAFYDQQKQRIFYFNHNSNGNNGIYIYNTIAGTIQTLFLSNTHSVGDILGFDVNSPITSINIIYNDAYKPSLDLDGDVLYWVDSLGRPSKLNIDRKLAGIYASYRRSFLDVAKAPPMMPIKCAYENDLYTLNNNLKNSLFQFIYRFVYDDGEKSVWSTGSEIPLPLFSENIDVAADPKKNCRINLYYSTGDQTVRKIELAVRRSSGGVVSDYGLITSIDKSTITEPASPNDILWNYLFYNNNAITPIDISEQILLQDYVPQKAKAQELLNGTTIIYGGITEGYNNVKDTDFNYTTGSGQGFININGILFTASQAGVSSYGNSTSIEVILSGAGTNDAVTNKPTTLTAAIGATFNIYLMDLAGNRQVITYTSASDSIITILVGLATSAQSLGLLTSVDGINNKLTISSPVLGPDISYWLQSAEATAINTLSAAFATTYKTNILPSSLSSAEYRYGVVYYDDKGRTNGVVSSDKLKVTTARYNFDGNYPQVSIRINGTPPDWAYYYNIVRTQNLTYDKNLTWATNRAFYNDESYGASSTSQRVVYLGIGNMIQYNEEIESTSGAISYDYSPGDRIRFLNRISSTGSTTNFNTGAEKDFEIIGVDTNPNINGYIANGTFIKIKYPTSYIDGDFQFFKATDTGVVIPTILLAEDYQTYKIQIYNTKKLSGDIYPYYEIGKQYAIGLPTQANRFHVGGYQSQRRGTIPSPQHALTDLYSGDNFYRYRNIPIGANYQFTTDSYTQNNNNGNGDQFSTVVINVQRSNNTAYIIDTPEYEIRSQVFPISACSLVAANYPNSATPDNIFRNKSASDMTVRVRGTLKASKTVDKSQYIVLHAKIVTGASATIQTIIQKATISETNTEYEFPFDAKIKVPVGSKLFLITECNPTTSNTLLVGAFGLQLDVLKNAEITIIEESFSDSFGLKLSSNSRPLVYDENAVNAYFPTLVRFSLPKEPGTNINNTNRFYPANMDEYDRQRGDIVRLKVRGSQMRVFQKRGCGMAGVLQNMLFNADGSGNLTQTNQIINKISYYQGDYGIGNLATSLTSSSNSDYFVDPIRGYQVRLSVDGMTPISALYKAQYYITNLANKYAIERSGTLPGKAKVLGVYDFNEEEYVAVFQGYSGQSNVTIGFNENRNSYSTFYDYAPEWITSAEGNIISFRNGQLYVHDSTTYCNYYGTQNKPSVTLVFNDVETIKKRYNTMTLLANKVWAPDTNGDITTNLGQSSSLQPSDFLAKDDKWHAAFKRDASSSGGLYNGNVLKGGWSQIRLKPVNGNEFVNLFYIELGILEPFYNR